MIRATLGSWISYATSILLYVLVANSLGTSTNASAFVLSFTVAISLTGIFSSSAQSLVVPRLMAPGGGSCLVRPAVRLWLKLAAGLLALLLLVVLASAPTSAWLSEQTTLSARDIHALLLLACVLTATQFLAISASSIAYVLGQRFLPAASPAGPSIVACAYLLVSPEADVSSLLAALALGSVLQAGLLLATLPRGLRTEESAMPPVGGIAPLTVLSFCLVAVLQPVERSLAAWTEPGGAALMDYALRSLTAAQQLIVAGAVAASLADWSAAGRAETTALMQSVRRRALGALAVLGAAALIGGLAAPQLVAIAYERGEFTDADTEAVATLLRLALPAFLAGGVGLILSQGLVAARRNTALISLGVLRGCLRLTLSVGGAAVGGVHGLVAGISLAEVLMLGIQWQTWLRGERITRSRVLSVTNHS